MEIIYVLPARTWPEVFYFSKANRPISRRQGKRGLKCKGSSQGVNYGQVKEKGKLGRHNPNHATGVCMSRSPRYAPSHHHKSHKEPFLPQLFRILPREWCNLFDLFEITIHENVSAPGIGLRTRLLVHLGFGGLCRQVPAAGSGIILLVLDCNLGQMAENVLHLGVAS